MMIHLSNQQLRQLIDSDDDFVHSPEINHLESCIVCQQKLTSLSGEGRWLEDWMQSARSDTGELSERDDWDIASSVVISVDSTSESAERVKTDPVRLDFLELPRHPELLGRLGRYDIERLIGMGGFGVVLKARDSELNRVVAIKVLAPHLMSSTAAKKRFAREAQASAAVVHDHVVPIYDVVSSNDSCYFVMQYIPGRSLQERVDREAPLPAEDILRIATQTAAGLHAAHEQGLIHRDVKPGNILLEDTVDRVLISDFGLARAADDASLTRSGAITGTPHYMSPEQARGETIDVRSDLFSLGSVIYFMATGHSPFRAERMMAVLNRICHEPHRPLADVRPDLPVELSSIVERLLHKSPESRYDSADHVRQVLNRTLGDLQSGRIRPQRTVVSRHNLAWPWSAALPLGIVVVLLAGLWVQSQWTHRPPTSPTGKSGMATKLAKPEPMVDHRVTVESQNSLPSALLTLPPDPFVSDFEETAAAMEELESAMQTRSNSAASSAWESEVADLHRDLERLERELSVSLEAVLEP